MAKKAKAKTETVAEVATETVAEVATEAVAEVATETVEATETEAEVATETVEATETEAEATTAETQTVMVETPKFDRQTVNLVSAALGIPTGNAKQRLTELSAAEVKLFEIVLESDEKVIKQKVCRLFNQSKQRQAKPTVPKQPVLKD